MSPKNLLLVFRYFGHQLFQQDQGILKFQLFLIFASHPLDTKSETNKTIPNSLTQLAKKSRLFHEGIDFRD